MLDDSTAGITLCLKLYDFRIQHKRKIRYRFVASYENSLLVSYNLREAFIGGF